MAASRRLHIRCGSDIRKAIELADIEGNFLEFADPFCQGPVRRWTTQDQIKARAAFISDAYELEHARRTRHNLEASYQRLEAAATYQDIVLWFEHDSYDQLILAYVLDRFANLAGPPGTIPAQLSLVSADHYPGVEPFFGLGQLAPAQLANLFSQRTLVTQAMLNAGSEVWQALTDEAPTALFELVRGDRLATLPFMGRALKRHLRELPDTVTGLGLTERLILETVQDWGQMQAGALFHHYMVDAEPLPYLGDTMFWYVLRGLMRGGAVATAHQDTDWPDRLVGLTELGQEVLAGRRDWLATAPARWVGGIEVGGSPGWRWDSEREAPVRS